MGNIGLHANIVGLTPIKNGMVAPGRHPIKKGVKSVERAVGVRVKK